MRHLTTSLFTFTATWICLTLANPPTYDYIGIPTSQESTGEQPIEFDEGTLTKGHDLIPGYSQMVSDSPDGFVSAPGCPESVDGHPWVQYGTPVRCYLVGERGPCNLYFKMGFRPDVSSPGYCKCGVSGDEPSDIEEGQCPVWNDMGQIRRIGYHRESDTWYDLFSRGPCSYGKIFAVTDLKSFPSCSENKCRPRHVLEALMSSGEPSVFDPSTSMCRRIGDHCQLLGGNEGKYQWTLVSVIPSCRGYGGYGSVAGSGVDSVGRLDCRPGQVRSPKLKRCHTPLKGWSSTVG